MVNQATKENVVVDIVFLVDVTGSMQPCIGSLKNNISIFVNSFSTNDSNTNFNVLKHWRAKAVGFRDFVRDADSFIDNPFVETAAELTAQLAPLSAIGDGDQPESLLDALYNVINIGQSDKGAGSFDTKKWRYRSDAKRVVFVFTDAPYRETMVRPAGGTVADVANAAVANRIVLSIFAPNMPCYDKLSEIDRSEVALLDYDNGAVHGPQNALAQFVEDEESLRNLLMETIRRLASHVSINAVTPAL